jgi:hypothetical protein
LDSIEKRFAVQQPNTLVSCSAVETTEELKEEVEVEQASLLSQYPGKQGKE